MTRTRTNIPTAPANWLHPHAHALAVELSSGRSGVTVKGCQDVHLFIGVKVEYLLLSHQPFRHDHPRLGLRGKRVEGVGTPLTLRLR
jgi:hypothetical protein